MVVRLAFVAFMLLTSIYCVLAYLPDTYFAFVQAPFQWWLPLFVRFHPYLYTVLFSLLTFALWTEQRRGLSRRFVLEFILPPMRAGSRGAGSVEPLRRKQVGGYG